ncbi:unnamed protein product, partial [Onchocerca ochengi]|uniref:ZM domain-containing protein n=1 Tax=Onchocerca ochengi TaxID=42157 RepID=A0A182ESI5_ONCOC
DENNVRNREESKIEANFLRRNMHDNRNNAKLQSTELIDNDDNNIITSSLSNLFPSNNVETAITTTGAIKPKLKSSTATRLRVLITDEKDTSAEKYENFDLASKTEDGKPHRIFPRSDQSSVQVNPSIEQILENENIVELSAWQKNNSRSLHRTTIHPNVHFIVRDGEIDRSEVASSIKFKTAPRANFLPKKKDEFALEEHESAQDLINLAQKLQPKNLIFDGQHEKLQQQQQQQQKQQQRQQQHHHYQQQQKQQQQQQQYQQQPQQQYKQSILFNNPKVHAQPTLVAPAKKYYNWNNQYQSDRQFPLYQRKQQQQQQQQQQTPYYQLQQQSPQYHPQQLFQYYPQQQQQSSNYQFQQPVQQHLQQQQQQQLLFTRDPQDKAYLREVEEYDHLLEQKHVVTEILV